MSNVHPQSRHVYKLPDEGELDHDTDNGTNCWCEPEAFVPCPECPPGVMGCWNCKKDKYPGLIEVPFGYKGPLVIIHNDR